ncbi:ABC transporter ATP-binding protein [Wohlfahrtiimonas chitiniclastica]|uniref:ABC transporter ATP-binding protein n=1 Tax=Wohlfahrtiimonas chitiniclastica TaxID=400946 RepID=UPI00036B1B23|nr:ATP-binding cassette domain-containing protein [Wohlfahrtiimonas chitiniclastica]
MLKLESIDVVVAKGTKLEREVLSNLNLEVKKGEFSVIIGGNGAGKSTLFNVISGFMKPAKGRILIDDVDVTNASQQKRAKDVSIVMQDPRVGTMERMTILENMAFAAKRGKFRGLQFFNGKAQREFFQDRLSLLNMGLEDRLSDSVMNLSGGQRQALSLIMAILADSKILLLDEITAALDPKIAETVMYLANKIVEDSDLTCLMITHNMHHAIEYGDRTMLLKNGQFLKTFTREEKQNISAPALAAMFEADFADV